MYRVKTMNKISPKGLSVLPQDRFTISDGFEDEQAILVRSAKLHDYDFPADLLAIARAGAGVNNIPLDRAADAGIVVFNTPGANANAVKELAIAALLLCARNITGGVQWVQAQAAAGEDVAAVVEKGKAQFAGIEILGKTLGVVGLGAIGIQVANAAVALGMTVVGYDPFLSVSAALSLDPRVRRVEKLPALYAESDYLSLHLPLTDDTRGAVNKAAFDQMKDSVRIVNLARAELVDDDDMITALESGKVAAYATDFPNSKITTAKNVIPIPHLGASSEESEENCAMMAAAQVQGYLDCGNIVNSVNYPALTLDWETPVRICVLFHALAPNTPDPVAAITNCLAKDGVSIATTASRIKGNYGYMLLDTNSPVEPAVVADLNAIDGILRVRILNK